VLGARVEVQGPALNGVIQVRKVSHEDEEDDDEGDGGFELEGSIDSADAGANTFVLRAVTVLHDADTRFEQGDAADLAAAAKVSVKGTLADGGTRRLARAIEIH
jgi:hypothetical protein